MTTRFSKRAGLLCLALIAASTTGCSSRGERADRPDNPFNPDAVSKGPRAPLSERELRQEASVSYSKAHDSLISGDYETAITRFGQVESRYPFSEYATQAALEKIYAQYRSFQADEAVLAADRFLREHPRHPNADYVQYVKGLTDYDRDNGIIDYLPLDSSKRDVANARHAYDDFAALLQKYPASRYAGDARKRMVYLRNRIAAHELSVANYYIRRGAWVAAAKRAEAIIAEYPGAPATASALLLLQECYTKLGEKQQIDEITQLIAANAASVRASKSGVPTPVEARSVVNKSFAAAPLPPAVTTTTATATTNQTPRKGFFGQVLDLFDGGLNKTYTIGDTGSAAAAASTSTSANAAQPDFAAPASLSTGPYSGPDSAVVIQPATTPATPAAAAAPSAAAPAVAADAPKEKKAGFFDFLNKTYTIGGKKDAATAPPAAQPEPAAATPASSSTAPAAPAAAVADDKKAEKPKSRIWSLDFLNKTYTIGGDSKTKSDDAQTAPPSADSTGHTIRATIDYPDATTNTPPSDGDKAKADSTTTPAPEPAK